MKTIDQIGAQGDVLVQRVDVLPAEAREVQRRDGAPLVVAHSETGHNHEVVDPFSKMYEVPGDPLVCYLQAGDAGDVTLEIVHQRAFDTHETLRLLGGLYKVNRQREMGPTGWQRVAD